MLQRPLCYRPLAVFRFLPLLCYAGLAAKASLALSGRNAERGPFHKGRTGRKSIGYGLPHTGSLGEQQVVIEEQRAGDRQELAHGSGAGMGVGSRILSAAAGRSPKVEISSCLSLVGEAGAWPPLLAL